MEVILAQRPGEDSYTPDWRELETHESLHVLVPHFETQEWVCSAMTSVLRRSFYTLFLSGVGRQKNRLRFTRSLLDTASQNPITRAHADTGMHCVPTREHGSLQPDLANSPVLVIWESAWIGIFESVTIL